MRPESLTLSSPKSAVQRRPADSEGNRVRERSRRHEEARPTPLGKRTAAAERNVPISSFNQWERDAPPLSNPKQKEPQPKGSLFHQYSFPCRYSTVDNFITE
ncbi:hypothetical protein RKD55_000598 [Rossellomorea marisflavi]